MKNQCWGYVKVISLKIPYKFKKVGYEEDKMLPYTLLQMYQTVLVQHQVNKMKAQGAIPRFQASLVSCVAAACCLLDSKKAGDGNRTHVSSLEG